MRHPVILLTPVLTGLLLPACKGPQGPVVTTTSTPSAPTWIDNEEFADGLGAVGIAQPNAMGDKSLQRTTAIADARTRLAGKMKVRVQNMFSQLNQQVTTAASDGGKPIKNDVMNRVVENVTRQLTDQELAGTSLRATWTDPKDGTLYVQVVLAREAMDAALAGTARAALRQEIAQGEQALDGALDKLDAAIAASR